jgi:hypothetical protein
MTARGSLGARCRSVAGVATAILLSTALPGLAQSPPTGAPASVAPSVVSLFRWSISEDAAGFDKDPLIDALVVGADGRVLLLGGIPSDAGVTPVVWGSDDARTWTPLDGDLPTGSVAIDGVALDDGFVIVTSSDVSSEGRLFRSDGTSLVPQDGPTGDLSAIERSPAGLHVLDGSAAPTLWTSTDDGATWVPVVITDEDAVVRDLAVTGDGAIVALGRVHAAEDLEVPTAWSSTDGGATWASSVLPLEPGPWVIGDLAATPIGLLARVVDATTDTVSGPNLLSRDDGATWQVAITTPGWGSVGTAGPEGIVFGTDSAWHSADGTTWTQEWWPTLAGFDIAASRTLPDGGVVATGVRTAPPGTAATFIGKSAPQAPLPAGSASPVP